jgi:hypothetical protein
MEDGQGGIRCRRHGWSSYPLVSGVWNRPPEWYSGRA